MEEGGREGGREEGGREEGGRERGREDEEKGIAYFHICLSLCAAGSAGELP